MKARALILFAFAWLALRAGAATISDNIVTATRAPELGPNDKGALWTFRPQAAHVVGLQMTSGRVIQVYGDSKGNFSVSLAQGTYDVGLNGSPLGWIAVPSGAGTYTLAQVGGWFSWLTDPITAYQVKLSTNDPSPGYLADKLLAGHGITLQSTSSNLTAQVDESALLLQNFGGLASEAQLLTNSATQYGQAPPSGSVTNGVYRTGSDGQPYWGPIPAFAGSLAAGYVPYATSTNALAPSPIQVTDTNRVSIPYLDITGGLNVAGDPTKTNIIGGAGTIVSNFLAVPYISLGGGTNQISDNGTNLVRNGSPIGGGVAANPTATIGATAINGSASTFMRSDAAPALTSDALSNIASSNPANMRVAIGVGLPSNWTASGTTNSTLAGTAYANGLEVTNNAQFDTSISLSTDVFLKRDAANTLALRNGTNAQAFNLYNTYTDASNYERLKISGNGSQGYAISTDKLGTGGSRDIRLVPQGNLYLLGGGLNTFYISGIGHFLNITDNTYDIGASGALRPRSLYLGTDLTVGNNVNLSKAITTAGTTGTQTINKTSGRVNFAGAATSLVVTNSLCTANSVIIATMGTADATAARLSAVPAAGQFTLTFGVAPTAETAVYFLLTN